jgi:hypothetical protein
MQVPTARQKSRSAEASDEPAIIQPDLQQFVVHRI